MMGNKVIDHVDYFPDLLVTKRTEFQIPKIPKSNPPLPNTHPKIPNVALQHQMHILKLVQKELPRQIWMKYKIGRKKYKKIPGRNTTNCQKEIQKSSRRNKEKTRRNTKSLKSL